MVFPDHMQGLDRVIEIIHDHFFVGPVQQPARKLDQPFGLCASFGGR